MLWRPSNEPHMLVISLRIQTLRLSPLNSQSGTMMPEMLDHVTFRTTDIEATREFLQSLLGLTVGYRPAFSFPGYWLYADGEPIVHLVPASGGDVDRECEGIDHIAFRLKDYDAMCRKLVSLETNFTKMDLPELGERRLFVATPLGILLELVFREDSVD